MHLRLSLRRPLAVSLALGLTVALAGATAAGPGDDPAGGDLPVAAAATRDVVTLITGDEVVVNRLADGSLSLAVDPAPRGDGEPTFQMLEDGDQAYVLPSDAARLVPEVLDRELFNVTRLVQYGYTDRIPIIAEYAAASARRAASATGGGVAGASVTATLSSIDAVAATVEPNGQWWRSVSAAGPDGGRDAMDLAAAGPLAGVEKVWLDGRVEASLAESVPQIGAPAGWDAGFDGTGVTVAVLDTGIDGNHPDLVGEVAEEENFSNSETTGDRHGHGTHVASIVTGSGAASEGTYVGVAPGVQLLNGKVLNDFGFGQESDIIEGMEWAAQQGADIINMSLGSAPTDGTDPVSTALNQLSDAHDVLFVVAAGNSGPGTQSVVAPAAADAALAVGNVSKSEALHILSSRGPRLGDYAVKPEITGPGVDIIAARSGGGTLPPPAQPVDEFHIRASGTSMAAPHVAGAAALMRQQRPELSAADLKAALVATAAPNGNLDIYQQGGGRVDVARAIGAPVHAAPATVDIGVFPYPHDDTDQAHAEVSYTNLTDGQVTLDLVFDVASRDGAVPGEAMLSVDPATVTLAPGGSTEVAITVDVTHGEIGLYAGYLVAAEGAEGAGVVTRTPLSFYKEEELHELTIEGIARDGRPAEWNSQVDVVNVDGSHDFAEHNLFFENGEVSLRLPPGVYSAIALIDTYLSTDLLAHETALVAAPEVALDGDTTVVLDARDAVELTVATPQHDDAAVQRFTFGYLRRGAGGSVISKLALRQEWNRFFAVPTEPAELGEFEVFTHWRLGEPGVTLEVVGHGFDPAFPPIFFPDSPLLDAELVGPLVDAGFGTPEDYHGLDAEGAVVLVRRGGPTTFFQKGANAAAAGAAALLVANDRPGQVPAFGIGPDATMPAVRLSQQDGDALLGLLGDREVTMRLTGQRNTDYLYELVFPEPAGVPSDLTYLADPPRLATVHNAFHSDVDPVEMSEFREMFRPWQATSVVFVNELVAPHRRTEYLTPGDTRHRQRAALPAGSMQEYLTSYQPGESREQSWWRQVTRPGVRRGSAQESARPALREQDTLRLELAEWTDAQGNWGGPGFEDSTGFRLFADGELVAETARPRGDFPLPKDVGQYRLELDVARQAAWWSTSTATRTAWTVRSQRPAGDEAEVIPLLLVDYGFDLDLRNTAPHPRDRRGAPSLELQIRHQSGADGGAIAGARAWISYDDGETWAARPVLDRGDGTFEAVLPARGPEHPEFLSLRLEAWDVDGNRIEQEITRAWKLP